MTHSELAEVLAEVLLRDVRTESSDVETPEARGSVHDAEKRAMGSERRCLIDPVAAVKATQQIYIKTEGTQLTIAIGSIDPHTTLGVAPSWCLSVSVEICSA